MTKAEEIARRLAQEYGIEQSGIEHIKDELESYALTCLEKAANNALVFDHFSGNKEELFDILDANQVDWKITVAKSTINTPDNLI
jgi:hypothetical protein